MTGALHPPTRRRGQEGEQPNLPGAPRRCHENNQLCFPILLDRDMPFIHYPVLKVVRTTGTVSFQPSLPACRSQAASTPQISACPWLRSSQARAQLLSSTSVVATGPAEGSLCPRGEVSPHSEASQRAPRAPQPPPAASGCFPGIQSWF